MNPKLQHHITNLVNAAPLASLRILFGMVTFVSTLRFMLLGWVDIHFNSAFQFKYFGFEWVEVMPIQLMYAIHILMLLASLGIMFGAYYRISAVLFFLSFTYCELIDITYYLNHYYFVSLIGLLLCIVPANVYYSVDAWRNPTIKRTYIPAWCINIFKAQLIIVYFFAGIAKINPDWLLDAMPLKIWLPAHSDLPVIGKLLTDPITAYIFSWGGMLFDISIGYFLLKKQTRVWAWLLVLFFHGITGWLFQIGVFPLVMSAITLVFFSAHFHQLFLGLLQRVFQLKSQKWSEQNHKLYYEKPLVKAALATFFAAWFGFQLLFPMRYLLYPGKLFWTEEGYRFSWRVMLMEKAGSAIFYITNAATQKEMMIDNTEFLNAHQEKQMATQPDLILQYAQYLKAYYKKQGVEISKVRADVYVTLNTKPSKLLIDNQQNLLGLTDSWKHKNWILPFENN
jgi:hypothetical protein